MKVWMQKHPLILALIALIIGELVLNLLPQDISLWVTILARVVLALIMILIIGYFGGREAVKWKKGDVGFSLKKSLYILIISALLFVMSSFSLLSTGLPSNWLILALGSLALALFVGIFEEALFRGIIFNALLSPMGKTRKGILGAAAISAIIFGLMHVIFTFFKGDAITPSFVLQGLLKTLQTGIFGFLLAAIYLKTKSIWGIALVHGIFDFFALLPEILKNANVSTNYIREGSSGNMVIIMYVVFLILSIPLIFIGWRIIKGIEIPEHGIFQKKE